MPPAIHHIIDCIYESARQPSGWEAVLRLISGYTGATSAFLLYQNHRFAQASLSAVGGEGPVGWAAETCHSAALLLAEPQRSFGAPGEWVLLPSVTPHSAGECYRQLGIAHVARGGMFENAEHSAVMEVHRAQDAPPFDTSLLEQLSPLSEHFERAFRIHALRIKEQLTQSSLKESVSHLALGVVLFNDAAQVVFYNNPAESLLEHNPNVRLAGQKLVVADPKQAELLRQSVAAVSSYRYGDSEVPFVALSLGKDEGYGLLRCWLMPLANADLHTGEAFDTARAVLFISDPTRSSPLEPARLMTVFGLTPKEAEIAAAIAEGYTIEEIAERYNRTTNTVRTHVKVIFRKTGVQRQSALVRLILDGTQLFSPPAKILVRGDGDG